MPINPQDDAVMARYRSLKMLARPNRRVDVVIDTDTFNEVDDQFAVAYALRSEDRLKVRALYAAPFLNDKSDSPADGMMKSYREILHILDLAGYPEKQRDVYQGSDRFMEAVDTPVESEAARHLVTLAMTYTPDEPLYVIALAAITNVASALLLEPRIRERIVVVWLGGHAHDWPVNDEFNLRQDIHAARVIFGSRVPLVQLPCMGVVSGFATSGPELKAHLAGQSALCEYLLEITTREGERYGIGPTWTRAIWDVTAVAWLVDPAFTRDRIIPAPMPTYDHHYASVPDAHLMRYVYHIDRDRLFGDLFGKLTRES